MSRFQGVMMGSIGKGKTMLVRELQVVCGSRILYRESTSVLYGHRELQDWFDQWKKREKEDIKIWLNAAVQGRESFSGVKGRIKGLLAANVQQVQYDREELPPYKMDPAVESLDTKSDSFCSEALTLISISRKMK